MFRSPRLRGDRYEKQSVLAALLSLNFVGLSQKRRDSKHFYLPWLPHYRLLLEQVLQIGRVDSHPAMEFEWHAAGSLQSVATRIDACKGRSSGQDSDIPLTFHSTSIALSDLIFPSQFLPTCSSLSMFLSSETLIQNSRLL